jgi:hypothetical protein
MISIWPSVGNDTPLGRELDQHGLRFEPLHWISKQARVYDAFSPLGREIYFKHIRSGLLDKGVDALWMDGTEVAVSSAMWNAMDNVRDTKALGNNALGDQHLNPYSLLTCRAPTPPARDQQPTRLHATRWAGRRPAHRGASWSGICQRRTLKQQIAGGVNVTITGNPYWTHDIGGFFVNDFPGGEQNPAYRELFARWFQYGAFNPIMRVHGTSIEREPYIFKTMDPPMYESLLDAVHSLPACPHHSQCHGDGGRLYADADCRWTSPTSRPATSTQLHVRCRCWSTRRPGRCTTSCRRRGLSLPHSCTADGEPGLVSSAPQARTSTPKGRGSTRDRSHLADPRSPSCWPA